MPCPNIEKLHGLINLSGAIRITLRCTIEHRYVEMDITRHALQFRSVSHTCWLPNSRVAVKRAASLLRRRIRYPHGLGSRLHVVVHRIAQPYGYRATIEGSMVDASMAYLRVYGPGFRLCASYVLRCRFVYVQFVWVGRCKGTGTVVRRVARVVGI